jgi:monomeric isocitrate dehydrogenase
MSKLQKIIWSKIDLMQVIGIYSLLLIVNAFSQSRYVEVVESDISHEG